MTHASPRPRLRPTLIAAALSAAALLACGSVTMPDDPTPDQPGAPGAPDPAAFAFAADPVYDERNDQIAYGPTGPVHTHAGATTPIVGEGCPDVYKYAYLMGPAPLFGDETNPNPLAWRVSPPTLGPIDPAAAYRVITGDGAALTAWTPVTTGADGTFAIALTTAEVPALATWQGPTALEVRVRDTAGVETIGRQCWTHHPLAAPLEVEAPRIATTAERLTAVSLASGAALAGLVATGGRRFDVAEHRVTNHTAEPVGLTLDFLAPAATYSGRIVDDYAQSPTALSRTTSCIEPPDTDADLCSMSDVPVPNPGDELRSGAITTSTWTFTVLDESTGAPLAGCARIERGATCRVPGRVAGAPARAYRVVLSVSGLHDLGTAPAQDRDLTLHGLAFTGTLPGETTRRCAVLRPVRDASGEVIGSQCVSHYVHTRFRGIDTARLDLAAFPFEVLTTVEDANVPVPPSRPGYLAGPLMAPALSWDGGNADLPGAQ